MKPLNFAVPPKYINHVCRPLQTPSTDTDCSKTYYQTHCITLWFSYGTFLHNSQQFASQKTGGVFIFGRLNASSFSGKVSKTKLTIYYRNNGIKRYPYDCNYEAKSFQRRVLSFPILATIAVIQMRSLFLSFFSYYYRFCHKNNSSRFYD